MKSLKEAIEMCNDLWCDLNWFGRVIFCPFLIVCFPIIYLVSLGMKK